MLVTGATDLQSFIQKHYGEACDNDYMYVALHVVTND